ncbi:hypothetical protein RYX36_003880 [Vicia faba]
MFLFTPFVLTQQEFEIVYTCLPSLNAVFKLPRFFESVGNVEMVDVIYDKAIGRSRGFGFVTMSSTAEILAVVQQFNGSL